MRPSVYSKYNYAVRSEPERIDGMGGLQLLSRMTDDGDQIAPRWNPEYKNDGELTRLEVQRDLDQRRLAPEAAARLLRLERRQVFRLLKAYRTAGPAGLISKRRGRRSNGASPRLRNAALVIILERYWDFGPTLAAEKLREVHGITLGRETLRLWMIEAGLWLDRKQRRKRVHQPRYRRDCVGELVQVDGCEHW